LTASERDGASVRLPPPLVYLLAVLVGGLLHWLAPLRLPLGPAARVGGAALATALGVAFLASALGLFRRTGQDPKPWVGTPEIIATGIYRFSRNPMYVGMALLLLAIGLGWASGWILVLILPVLAIVHATAIRHEEAYLERKFGAQYLAYKSSTRRWL